MTTDDVRPHVVDELFRATTNAELSEDHLRELLWNATPDERQAVADMHGDHARHNWIRAQAQLFVWTQLWHRWCASGRDPDPRRFTMSKGLKIVPRSFANEMLHRLYDAGFTEAEIGFPDPRKRG